MFPLVWTKEDATQARAEGWWICHKKVRGTTIYAHSLTSSHNRFRSHKEAREFVQSAAALGSPLHQRAWNIHERG